MRIILSFPMGIRWFSSGAIVTSLHFLSFFFPSLQEGDKLALMVTPERELIFFVKGEQIVKIVITAEATYGFIELWGLWGDSVRLIPDLREVRK